MILPFSTQLNGKLTHFVEKIWKGLKELTSQEYEELSSHLSYSEKTQQFQMDQVAYDSVSAKLHTIREDLKNRWAPGKLIHFVVNNRQPDYYQFAPVLKCISTQQIEIKYNPGGGVNVFIDGRFFFYQTSFELTWDDDTELQMSKLARNDGFDSINDFFKYFNKDFKGKIIHWTKLKY